LNQIGNIYFITNSFIQANKYYYAAVESDGKNAEARYNLANTLEKLNKIDEAMIHYKIFLKISSSEYAFLFPKVRHKLSVIHNKNGSSPD